MIVTFSKANDKIRSLKAKLQPAKGKAPLTATQRAGALNEVTKRLGASYRDKSIVFSVINRDSELVAKRFFADDVRVNEILTAISFGEI